MANRCALYLLYNIDISTACAVRSAVSFRLIVALFSPFLPCWFYAVAPEQTCSTDGYHHQPQTPRRHGGTHHIHIHPLDTARSHVDDGAAFTTQNMNILRELACVGGGRGGIGVDIAFPVEHDPRFGEPPQTTRRANAQEATSRICFKVHAARSVPGRQAATAPGSPCGTRHHQASHKA